MDKRESWIEPILAGLRAKGLERSLNAYPRAAGRLVVEGRRLLNLSSNDYLGLASDPRVLSAAADYAASYGAGSGGSRLMTGTLECHLELEKRLSEYKQVRSVLLFSSGYLANLGAVCASVGRDDVVFADRLSHASLVDAVKLSRARLVRFRHNDAGHLEELLCRERIKRKPHVRFMVVTESVFSMDGDTSPLAKLCQIAERHDALFLVDEAHATGVLGPDGRGLVNELGLEEKVSLSVSTLSKAFGSSGGFVASSEQFRRLLINRARSFTYNTAIAPPCVGAALRSLSIIEEAGDLGQRVLGLAREFRQALSEAGFTLVEGQSAIVPVLVGESEDAVRFSLALRSAGIIGLAVREPTVPRGTARIRFSVSLSHSREDLIEAVSLITEAARSVRIL